MWQWVIVFLSMALSDFLYAEWTLNVSKKNPVAASAYAFAVIIAGGYTILLYVHDGLLILPAAAGAAVGTWAAVSWAARPPK